MNKRTLGIIGGMGPRATADLFCRIIESTYAKKDQEHFRIIIDNNPNIDDRSHAIYNKMSSPLTQLLAMATQLENVGADFLAMPCNTAHFWYEEIANQISIPLLNMVELTAEFSFQFYGQRHAISKFGLLATTATIQKKIYHAAFDKFGLEILVLSPGRQSELVTRNIYLLKSTQGERRQMTKKTIDAAIHALACNGATAIVLGCTEISMLYKTNKLNGIPLINPSQVLAEACVDLALNRARF